MSRRPMTARGRVAAALQHRTTDRIPIAMVCAGIREPARTRVDESLRHDRGVTVDEYLEKLIDIVSISPSYKGPPLRDGNDIWGVRRARVPAGAGHYDEIVLHPLAEVSEVDELNAFPWPSPDDFDYSAIAEAVRNEREGADRCIMTANGNIFESSWYMRGFERMFLDFIEFPKLAEAILDRVLDFFLGYFERVLSAAAGGIELVFTADDLGGQQGLLLSREMWERFIKPRHERLNAVIHDHGARVIYHTDGAVMEVVDGLVDMGIDILQALQFDAAGMDPAVLKRRFGGDLCFEGGVSVQRTLPFGTVDDVRAEVRSRIDTLGENGGYILGPSHAIQAGTPAENIVAMFDTAAEYYPFSETNG